MPKNKITHKTQPGTEPIKKGKYDIAVKIPMGMTADDLLKLAVNTPIKNSKTKKEGSKKRN